MFKRVALAFLAVTGSVLLFTAVYETVKHVQYYRWKARYQHDWLGRVIVRSPNERLIWEYRPHARHGMIALNEHGFRDRKRAKNPPPGTVRYAFIGDSIALGSGVEAENTLVSQFERIVNQALGTNRIQALNFGISGYNTLQIRELLASRVLDFAPDVVVYVMCLNDFDIDDASDQLIRYFRKPRSFLLQKLKRLRHRRRGKDWHLHYYNMHRELIFNAVGEMDELAEARDIRFVTAVVPVFYESFRNYPLRTLHRAVSRQLRKRGIVVIDLLPAFVAQAASPERLSLDPWHPNPRGHRVIAQALSESPPLRLPTRMGAATGG